MNKIKQTASILSYESQIADSRAPIYKIYRGELNHYKAVNLKNDNRIDGFLTKNKLLP